MAERTRLILSAAGIRSICLAGALIRISTIATNVPGCRHRRTGDQQTERTEQSDCGMDSAPRPPAGKNVSRVHCLESPLYALTAMLCLDPQ